MPQLVARTCFQQPDLGMIWERIRRDGVQSFQEVVLNAIPTRNYKILNPEVGLYAEQVNPFLVMDAYEDMYAALFAARDNNPRMAGRTCLFYIGQPGIGEATFFACIAIASNNESHTGFPGARQDHVHAVRLRAMLPGEPTSSLVLALWQSILSACRLVGHCKSHLFGRCSSCLGR